MRFPGHLREHAGTELDQRFQRSWGDFADRLPSRLAEPTFSSRLSGRAPAGVADTIRTSTSGCRHRGGSRVYVLRPGSPDFEMRRERFRSVMGRSRFVLCPRGKGTSSIRLYEALAYGCVPVIISDDWVAPAGPTGRASASAGPRATPRAHRDARGRDARWHEMGRAGSVGVRAVLCARGGLPPDDRALLGASRIGARARNLPETASGAGVPRRGWRCGSLAHRVLWIRRTGEARCFGASRAARGRSRGGWFYDSAARVVMGPRQAPRGTAAARAQCAGQQVTLF